MATRRKSTTAKSKSKPAAKPAAKPAEEKQSRASQVKAMDFVPVWQGAESADEVADEFGRDAAWAGQYASRLRGMGINLKKMPRSGGGKKIDVDELNALAEASLK